MVIYTHVTAKLHFDTVYQKDPIKQLNTEENEEEARNYRTISFRLWLQYESE